MNSRRDEQYERQQFGRHNAEYDERYRDDEGNAMRGRGQEDGRPDSQRGWDREGFGGSWRTEGLGGRLDEQGRMSDPRGYDRLRRDSTSYGGYGYGGYGEQSLRGESMRGTPMMGPRRWANEGLSNDFSLEGTRNFERDERMRMNHRGKGPKGYKRSDERIREDASQILTDHQEIDATDIEVSVKDGEVTLSGTVPDRWTKRLAEAVVENVSGILDIHNRIRVARPNVTNVANAGPASRSQH